MKYIQQQYIMSKESLSWEIKSTTVNFSKVVINTVVKRFPTYPANMRPAQATDVVTSFHLLNKYSALRTPLYVAVSFCPSSEETFLLLWIATGSPLSTAYPFVTFSVTTGTHFREA